MQTDFDLIIVGAGLAGNCLALALKDSPLKIAVVESASRQALHNSALGDRALALAAGTVQLLQSLDAWSGVAEKATAIRQIHVSDRGHFGKTRLSAAWQKTLGDDYDSAFIFAYRFQNIDVDFDGREIFDFNEDKYLFLAVRFADYVKYMKQRSPKWKTVTLAADKFRQCARPITDLILPA